MKMFNDLRINSLDTFTMENVVSILDYELVEINSDKLLNYLTRKSTDEK